MNFPNHDDVKSQLQAAGLKIDALEVGTARPVRCRVEGHDAEKRGWYWLYGIDLKDADGQTRQYIAGAFGVYHGNDNGKQKVSIARNGGQSLRPEEKAAIAARHKADMARLKAARDAEAHKAAERAGEVWQAYLPTGESGYLAGKGVGAYGVRFAPSGHDTIVVPMLKDGTFLCGLQLIRGKDRGRKPQKQYWPAGMNKHGAYHLVGPVPAGLLLLCEGYATGASLFEATGLPAVIAFDAGSLQTVALSLKKRYPASRLLICADDDYRTEGNPGQTAARLAATAASGVVVVPVFQAERPADKKGPTDFNDLHQLEGLHVVRSQIEAAIVAAGWKLPVQGGCQPLAALEADAETVQQAVSCMTLMEVAERFVFIDEQTGGYVFDTITREVCKRDKVVALLPRGVRWDDVKDHPSWRARAVYMGQIGFDPTETDPGILCNTWKGWPTKARPGTCGNLLFLLRWLCSEEESIQEALYRWVLRWLAYPIRNPGAKMQTALVVHGPQGSGKNMFFEAVAKIYGVHGTVLTQGALEDRFNADWCQGKLFVIADEVVARSDVFHLKNQLKSLITGETVRVNPKNMPAHTERNHMNIVFLSNDSMPVILEEGDRRHCVIWTPPKLEAGFYESVGAEIAAGGIAALHHHLLQVDLTGFCPWTKPPVTHAKTELIEQGRDSTEQFIQEWQEGMVVLDENRGPLPFCPCESNDLYRAYLDWCKQAGVFGIRQRMQKEMVAAIGRMEWMAEKTWVLPNLNGQETERIKRRVIIPSDESLKSSRHDGRSWLKQADRTKMQWLTAAVLNFRNALNRMN